MSLESLTIITASGHHLEVPNASGVPSRSVINCSQYKSRVWEADDNKNKESKVDSESLVSPSGASPYSSKMACYITGFVSLKLEIFKVWTYYNALLNKHLDAIHELISVENKGYKLCHPEILSSFALNVKEISERKF